MNLVVLGDSKGGSIVLCHEEHYMSSKKADVDGVKQKQVNKYMVSLIPRVVLVPSISEESGAVLDYALVRSLAPNILVRFDSFKEISRQALISWSLCMKTIG
jgi:hypothetical protein